MRLVLSVSILLLSAASTTMAQRHPRTIQGIVVDSGNHKPLSQAVIYVGRIATGQRTGNDGVFTVTADSEPLVVMVRHWGYVPVIISVGPGTDSVTNAGTVGLRQVKKDEDRAAVANVDMAIFPELYHFYQRKAHYKSALFLTPDDLQRVGGNLINLIREKQGFHFICFVNKRDEVDCGQQASRGRTSIMNPNPTSAEQEPCLMTVWDNALSHHRTLDEYLMDDVLAVEAYPNPSATPPDFAGSPCAALMLWMKPQTP
ncbi:MAG TPA: hypothetical protein VH439_00935 [Gemmatimonadales bacterium]